MTTKTTTTTWCISCNSKIWTTRPRSLKRCRNCRWIRKATLNERASAGTCNRCFRLIGPGLARMTTGDYLCLQCDQTVCHHTGEAVVRE